MDLLTSSQLQSTSQHIALELTAAERGAKNSFQFIRHTFSHTPLVKSGEVFQILTIGGTVFKKALAKKEAARVTLLQSEEKSQPVFPTEESLLVFILSELSPQVTTVAINFAYPLTPIFEQGKLDGILISGSKENAFTGILGKRLCQTIERYVLEKTQRHIQVSCANDTICLLLSGLIEKTASQLAAGIVGTGLNFALFLDEKTGVNLEVANFDKFPVSEEGKQIDAGSISPGSALFEKEVSGMYLFQKFNLLAEKHGVDTRIHATDELELLVTRTDKAGEIARFVLAYSAQLVGCVLAGISLYKKSSLTFVMEGSLFWKGYQYKELAQQTAVQVAPQFPPTCIAIADSYFFGPAQLVS